MRWRLAVAVLAGVLVALAILYRFALPGLSSARPSPPTVEVAVATWLLRHSVAARSGRDGQSPETRRGEYRGRGGSLPTAVRGLPRVRRWGTDDDRRKRLSSRPLASRALPSLTDGQVFTFIHDGIRNTAMPAWNLPDREIWQIVSFLRHLPPTVEPGSAQETIAPIAAGAHYVGSAACKSCHQEIFERWRRTRMANVVRDPREHPDAIIPDFSQAQSGPDIHQGRRRVRLRQPMEAAVFHTGAATTSSRCRRNGTSRTQTLASLSCSEQRRLVGAALS